MRRRNGMRVSAGLCAGLVVIGGLAGCTHARSPGSRPTPPAGSVRTDPLRLVGAWTVKARGERARTALILGSELRLVRPCGELFGSWLADHSGTFIGEANGGSQGCFIGPHPDPHVRWLDAAVRYRVAGSSRELLDVAGNVVATLLPGAHPSPPPGIAPSEVSPPSVTPSLARQFEDPKPLPPSVRPATLADTLGRWSPAGPHAGSARAYIEFKPNGSWLGSDGCNGAGGRFAVGPAGELLTTSGPSTLIGCDNSPAPGWVAKARRIGVDHGRLVLFDGAGHLLGRLARPQRP